MTGYRERVRDAIVARWRTALADEPRVRAIVEGGSAATGRLDQHSDIDFGVMIAPGATADDSALTERVFAELEAALTGIDRIAQVCPVIESPWGATFVQRFYLLESAPPFFMLDVWVAPETVARPFLEVERHGTAVVYLEREGAAAAPAFDAGAHRARMVRRRAHIRAMWPVMRRTLDKDLARGRWLDAFGFYTGGILRPLTELAGMRHRPERFDFGWRYLHFDLPPDLVSEFLRLAYVASPDALRALLPATDKLSARLLDETSDLV